MEFLKHPERLSRHILSLPFIYAMIAPLVILDIFLEIYHHICFPLCGIPLVVRSSYIRIDRHKLSYLTWWQKLHCAYCGYANGLLQYASKIASNTEKYWCGIQHKSKPKLLSVKHQKNFLPYGDEDAFRDFVQPTNDHHS